MFLALPRLLSVVRLCAIFLAVTSEQHVKIIFGKIFFKPSGFKEIWYQKFMSRGKNASSFFSLYFPVETNQEVL